MALDLVDMIIQGDKKKTEQSERQREWEIQLRFRGNKKLNKRQEKQQKVFVTEISTNELGRKQDRETGRKS